MRPPLVVHAGRFLPVGHGLFHAGRIIVPGNGGPEFTYAYDCGTLSARKYIRESVDAVLNETSRKELHLLIISHLHDDHMNGLDFLLGNITRPLRRAVLPYLAPFERAFVAALSARGRALPPEYAEFIASPAAFLLDRGAIRVTFVVPGALGMETGDSDGPKAAMPPERVGPDDSFGMGGIWRQPNPLSEDQIDAIRAEEGGQTPSDAVEYVGTNAVLCIPAWKFQFYLEALGPWKRDALRAGCQHVTQGLPLERVVMDRTLLLALADQHRRLAHSDLNVTSLVALSSSPFWVPGWYHLRAWLPACSKASWAVPWPPLHRCLAPRGRAGVLLTGDLPITAERWSHMEAHLRVGGGSPTCEVAVLQVPHHGSRRNWCKELAEIDPSPIYAVSAASRGRHPHARVMRDIKSRSHRYAVVTENVGCPYWINIHAERSSL